MYAAGSAAAASAAALDPMHRDWQSSWPDWATLRYITVHPHNTPGWYIWLNARTMYAAGSAAAGAPLVP
jgi:hypothetical protein